MVDSKFWAGFTILVIAAIWGVWLAFKEREKRKSNGPKSSMSFREGLNLTGFPVVTFTNNNRVFNFLLDTGSNVSLIDESVLKQIKYEEAPSEIELYGLDGIERTSKCIVSYLSYEGYSYKTQFYVTNLSPTFRSIKQEHGVTLHGILGSDFFKAYRYVLNFDKLIAYSELANSKK